jgi:hypothetical protein
MTQAEAWQARRRERAAQIQAKALRRKAQREAVNKAVASDNFDMLSSGY